MLFEFIQKKSDHRLIQWIVVMNQVKEMIPELLKVISIVTLAIHHLIKVALNEFIGASRVLLQLALVFVPV